MWHGRIVTYGHAVRTAGRTGALLIFCLMSAVPENSPTLFAAHAGTPTLSPRLTIGEEAIRREKVAGFPRGIQTIYIEDDVGVVDLIRTFCEVFHRQGDIPRFDLVSRWDEIASGRVVPEAAILNPAAAERRSQVLYQLNPGLRVLLISGIDKSAHEVRQLGGTYFLRKPFRPQMLSQTLLAMDRDARQGIIFETRATFPAWFDYIVEPAANHSPLRERIDSQRLEYGQRLVRHQTSRELFFVKAMITPSPEERHKYAWERKNDPIREAAATAIIRQMDGNVCDIIIPQKDEAEVLAEYIHAAPEGIYLVRVSEDYSMRDREVRQIDPVEAFTRALVAAILIRKWDFHMQNLAVIKDAPVLMMFDNDQAFHPDFQDMEKFTMAFIDNFFAGRRHQFRIDPDILLRQVSLPALRAAVEHCEARFDIENVRRELRAVGRELPFPAQEHLEFTRRNQRSIRRDVMIFFEHLYAYQQRWGGAGTLPPEARRSITDIRHTLSLLRPQGGFSPQEIGKYRVMGESL